ncbi:hypothetical protein FQA39_LY02833 [Lamprigera yunnana]|nr:hypothetical protein FQA39_LY02833 [Lamprigera yunnana]
MSYVKEICTKQLLENILGNYLKTSLKVSDVHMQQVGEIGDNFCSDILRVTVNYDADKDEPNKIISIIVKCILDNELIAAFERNMKLSEKEHGVYRDILPQILKLGVKEQFSPTPYYMELFPRSIMFLEDLCSLGYEMVSRDQGLDLQHSIFCIEKLARFHASSVLLSQQNPNLLNKYNTALYYKNPHFDMLSLGMYEDMKAVCGKVQDLQVYHNKMQKLVNFGEKIHQAAAPSSEFNVLNHGDFWTTNMMFRYTPNKKIEDVMFFDYQLSYFGSPAIDLHYFIVTSTDLEVKMNHLDILLNRYFDKLLFHLRKLNVNNVPTRKELYADFVNRAYIGFACICVSLPLTTVPRTNDASLDNYVEEEKIKDADSYRYHCFNSERYINLIRSSCTMALLQNLLTKEFFEAVLKKAFRNVFNVLNVQISEAIQPGENFTSELLRIHVSYSTTDGNLNSAISLIGKSLINDELIISIDKDMKWYDCEFGVYGEILPLMNKLGNNKKFGPEAYWISTTPRRMLLLEDLSALGYKTKSRYDGLDLEHCLMAVEKLADFHASSVLLQENNPLLVKKYNQGMFYNNKTIKTMLFISCKELINTCKRTSGFQKYYNKFRRIDNILDRIDSAASPSKSFNVLNHGDFWCNNIMFHYKHNGTLHKAVFIDYQLSYFTSPVVDLHYFLVTSTNVEVKRRHMNAIISLYFKRLILNLHEFGVNICTTFEELFDEFKQRSFIGMATMSLALVLFKAPEGKCPDDCKLPTFLYESFKCKPVCSTLDDCPTSYDCSMINKHKDKCYYNGNYYSNRENAEDDVTWEKCFGCTCDISDDGSQFYCYYASCQGPLISPGCVLKLKLGQCCTSDIICAPYKECTIGNTTFTEDFGGLYNRLEHPTEKCTKCSCEEGSDKIVGVKCQKQYCTDLLKFQREVKRMCAPLYESTNYSCCPSQWICPSDVKFDTIAPSDGGQGQKCVFGKQLIGKNKKHFTQYDERKVVCECLLPPFLTCAFL